MLWLLISFVLSIFYSGVLRASLISPYYSMPIETVHDIVHSGLPWKMVLFGSPEETMLSKNPDESYITFWRDKEVVPYSDFPYEIVGVFERSVS